MESSSSAAPPPRSRSEPLKAAVATPLGEVRLVDENSRARLRALSVTTVEELLGLIAADPDQVAEFVPELNLPKVQADAQGAARAPVLAEMERYVEPDYAMGAEAPEGVEVEERASVERVESWLQAAEAEPAREEDQPPAANLIDCFGPVRNQGKRGTCVAHATCAVLECQETRRLGNKPDLSEQFIYWNAKANDGHPDRSGTWLKIAMPLTERDGACDESVWPYVGADVAGNEGQGPPPQDAQADAQKHLLRKPRELNGHDSGAIRAALDEGLPVGISVPVYNNWYSNPAAHLLGLIPMPLPNSVIKGGHAMCAMGYGWDNDFAGGGYLILRNSWGSDWAPQSPVAPGYGAIPLLYIDEYGWEAWTTENGN